MAYVTQMTSIIVYVVFHLISSLFICTRADVISECANATSCIGTYADIYKSLASDVNSFNIKSALYPVNEPSSVLIFVNIYGQNRPDKTGNGFHTCCNEIHMEFEKPLCCFFRCFPGDLISLLDTADSTHARTKHHNSILLLQCFCKRQEKND